MRPSVLILGRLKKGSQFQRAPSPVVADRLNRQRHLDSSGLTLSLFIRKIPSLTKLIK